MEVIETIVIQNAEVERKETVVSAADADEAKAEFIWTLQATWHLVNTRLEMDQAFEQPVCKKKKLWEMVAEKVNARLRDSGVTEVTVKAYECDLKWRNMLATLPSPPPAAAPCGTRPPQDVLQLYMELQERKMNMWAQQKALEERKIEAINNLAQAISSLAQKNSAHMSRDGN
uniref:Si:dkey-66i24.7 n=1 Tax=Tetraodon nigroviridis TaxID=99883 RepID=H3DBS6_TETNG